MAIAPTAKALIPTRWPMNSGHPLFTVFVIGVTTAVQIRLAACWENLIPSATVSAPNVAMTMAQVAAAEAVPAPAITPQPARHGLAATGMNTAATVVNWWIPARATAPMFMIRGNITAALATADITTALTAAKAPIPMAVTPHLHGIRSTVPRSTAFPAIAPPALPQFPPLTQVTASAMEAGKITTEHSIDGSRPALSAVIVSMSIPAIHFPMEAGQITLRHSIDAR